MKVLEIKFPNSGAVVGGGGGGGNSDLVWNTEYLTRQAKRNTQNKCINRGVFLLDFETLDYFNVL